jgi:hypothetical protein
MPLSINPITNLANNITSELSNLATAANQTAGNIGLPNTNFEKQNLDATINRLSGGFGSDLNGITGSINSASFSNLSGTVQNFVQSGVNSLSGAVGSFAQVGKGVIENIASGGAASGLATGLINGALQGQGAQAKALAGAALDLISGARSRNIPSATTLALGTPASVVQVYPSSSGDWRVKVSSMFGTITFPTTPTMSLSNKANYNNQDLVHANFPHPVYKNSVSDDISISGEFPVETDADAANWLRTISLGRALTKMFFGGSGNPPPICTLSGYGKVLKNIPVVIKSFQVDLKDDVHYIQSGGASVPRMSTIQISCMPVYSKSSQRGFSLGAYANNGGNIPF